ncbi:MAG TPA: DUF1573 domain-containing protein [Bacteroidales bacterium]|nr:DUF1573 domain-containing protein [Bacteroidales bacterium]
MKTKLLLSLLILFSVAVYGQNKAVIMFDKTVHDFGKFKEEGGKVSTEFNFTNNGNEKLEIATVKPSCGCITAEWTQTPVAPGGKGFVKVFYDPNRRPGVFEKSVWVSSNALVPEVTLNIKGEVIPKVKTLLDSFPVKNGNILMASNAFYLRNVSNKEVKKDSLLIYNSWNNPVTLAFKDLPTFIKCSANPSTLAPKQRGKIYITYDASKKNAYGIVTDTVSLMTNDFFNPEKKMLVTATIVDDFSKLTDEQKKNAPGITFTTDFIDYGTVKTGDIVKKSFEFTNKGKDTLFIRKVAPYRDDCKVSVEGKTAVAAGESSKIIIEFNTKGLAGEEKRTVLVNTNDPARPFLILIIQGKITP